MFRAEIRRLASGPILKMEGRLVGESAEQTKTLITKALVPRGLIVDVTEVSYVDSVGEQVLTWFCSIGAAFVAKTVYAAGVCERLHLPLQEELSNSSRKRHRGGVRRSSPGHPRVG
jgi:hypothetical protein